MSEWIIPDWPAPQRVQACSTLRHGGVSTAPWDSLNLGAHVGDAETHVLQNRQYLKDKLLPVMPQWLNQVHGQDVVRLPADELLPNADAAITRESGVVCAIMTADCLPVLFCSDDGSEVAAAHAGWRGLCNGVLEQTLQQFRSPAREIHAWLGPAIGPQAFEVGAEVREAFLAHDVQADAAFRPVGDKFFANIWQLARQRLQAAGVHSISGSQRCTFTEANDFFSYRRDGITGRMATLIWLR